MIIFLEVSSSVGMSQDKHLSFCLCPPCWKNDLNNVAGIDDIKD